MGRGSGSIRPHLAVLLLLTGVLAGLLLRTPVPSVPTPLPQGEVGERIAAALPAELSPLRRAFVESGAALVGRVGYFWGGKSDAVGWDARWASRSGHGPGQQHQRGDLPFGLDCSGFVSWCAVNAAGDPAAFAAVGNGVRAQRALCAPGGLGRRPPRRSGLLSRPVPCGDRGRPGRGRRASGAPLLLLPGGRGVLPRRQGRGLYRPGPSLLV